MFYDPLQEKLREMEEKNPSAHQYKQWPWKSLWDKIKFYKRWKNNEVKHIPQKESISVSLENLDEKVAYFEKLLKNEPLPKNVKNTLSYLLTTDSVLGNTRREMENWIDPIINTNPLMNYLTGYHIPRSQQSTVQRFIELIYDIHEQIIREKGPGRIEEELDYLRETARKADDNWDGLQHELNNLREFAEEVGIDISHKLQEIKEIYFSEGVKKAPEKIDYWIKEAEEELRKGEDPTASFSIARDYAEDAGLEFPYELEITEEPRWVCEPQQVGKYVGVIKKINPEAKQQ